MSSWAMAWQMFPVKGQIKNRVSFSELRIVTAPPLGVLDVRVATRWAVAEPGCVPVKLHVQQQTVALACQALNESQNQNQNISRSTQPPGKTPEDYFLTLLS